MVARIGSWQDSNIQMKYSREAIKLIKKYLIGQILILNE